MFLFRKKFHAAQPPARPLAPFKLGFSLDYWRSREDLLEYARNLYRTEQFQEWLAVLHHELPLDSIDAVRGHRRLLRIMELMAEPIERPSQEIQPTFGAEKEFPELLQEIEDDK